MNTGTTRSLIAGITFSLACATAHAVVDDTQVSLLGTSLTPWGAEIAGTPDGSYPAYEGGLRAPPPGFDPGSGTWPDPWPEDKPLFSVDAKNMEQHRDRLMEAQMELMRRFPSYRIDVYATRRSAMVPEQGAANALANARNPECRTSPDGVGLYGCWGGTPFPIPGNGHEVMWNHLLTYTSPGETNSASYLVNANGAVTMLLLSSSVADYPYFNPAQKPYEGAGIYYLRSLSTTLEPARETGTQTLLWYPLSYDVENQRAWSYQAGQRRVRLAPEFAYDTPVAQFGGAMFFDEINLFAGRMDRFEFDLKGRKLMYMPYNNYRMHLLRGDPAQLLGQHHFQPEHVRYELRRVWVVEATPLPNARHMAARKLFYLDEDSWIALAYEGWDQSNRLFRLLLSNGMSNYYTVGILQGASVQAYDLARGQYAALQMLIEPRCFIRYGLPQQPDTEMAPARMGSRGIR